MDKSCAKRDNTRSYSNGRDHMTKFGLFDGDVRRSFDENLAHGEYISGINLVTRQFNVACESLDVHVVDVGSHEISPCRGRLVHIEERD